MEVRLRETGQVMAETQFRSWLKENNGPTYNKLTSEVAEILQVDIVLEGPQAQNLAWWQHSMRQGIEQGSEGKWYKKYIAGPTFETQQEQDDYIAVKTVEKNQQLFKEIQELTQGRLDNFSQTRNYSSILSLCTYANSSLPKFQKEGQYGVVIRDLTWAKLYEILADIEAGTRPVPNNFNEIEPELPTLTWID